MRRVLNMVAATAFGLLAGCSSAPAYKMTAAEMERYANVPAETLVTDLSTKLAKAAEDKLDYYAPVAYKNATSALEGAKKLQGGKGKFESVVQYIASGDNSIANGYVAKETAIRVLADVFALDAKLQALSATKHAASDYEDISDDIGDLIEYLEKGDTATVDKKRPRLIEAMSALRVRLTKQFALAELQVVIKKLNDEKAESFAPLAMAAMRETHARADAFIQANPDDADGIAKVAKEALTHAQRAVWVADRVRVLRTVEKGQFEQTVQEEEQWLSAIGTALSAGDLRSLDLAQASAALTKRAQEINESLFSGQTEKENLLKEKQLLTQKLEVVENSNAVLTSQVKLLQDLLGNPGADKAAVVSGGSAQDATTAGDAPQPAIKPVQ